MNSAPTTLFVLLLSAALSGAFSGAGVALARPEHNGASPQLHSQSSALDENGTGESTASPDDTAASAPTLVPGSALFASQITLEQAVREALTNNKELQVKRLAVKTVEAERLKAHLWSSSNPELEVDAVSDLLTANTGEGTLQLGLSQEIELGGQRGHRTSIADAHIELARLELAVAEETLRRNVRAVFYSVLLAQQRLSFVDHVDSLASALRDTAAVRVTGGFLPKSELTFLDLDRASSRTSVHRTRAALAEAQTQLMWLIGGTTDSALEAVGEVPYEVLSLSEDSIVALAVAHRPELQESRLRQRLTSAELGLAYGERIPNLRLGAYYSRQRSVFGSNNFIGFGSGGHGLKDTDHLFGIKFSVPLPLIDKRRSEIARSRSQVEVNTAAQQSAESQIRNEARSAVRVLKFSEMSVALLQGVLPESDSLFQSLQNAYAQGRLTVADYLPQKDRLLGTRLNLLDAYSAYVLAQKECERAVGIDWNRIRHGGD
ncbi:MAG: TolC family protein [Acidobacteria bacterium]|nr:TolC family protein [Acidobacteriota bacterium]